MSTIQLNQLWLGIFWIIQNTWIFGRSSNNKKCSKLDFLPSQIFLDFYSPSTYFYWAKNRNPCLLNQKKEISVGPACQPHGHLPLLASIAVRSSPGAHLHRALLLPAALPPCISLVSRQCCCLVLPRLAACWATARRCCHCTLGCCCHPSCSKPSWLLLPSHSGCRRRVTSSSSWSWTSPRCSHRASQPSRHHRRDVVPHERQERYRHLHLGAVADAEAASSPRSVATPSEKPRWVSPILSQWAPVHTAPPACSAPVKEENCFYVIYLSIVQLWKFIVKELQLRNI
jgi:hypothetical protein